MSIPNPRDIAVALHTDSLVPIGNGYALVRKALRNSVHLDFAKRPMTIQAGDMYVQRLAMPTRKQDLQDWLVILARSTFRNGRAIWVEHFEEDRATIKLLTETGFVYIGTKVSAFADLKGVYVIGRKPTDCVTPPTYNPVDLLSLRSLGSFLSVDEIHAVRAELDSYNQLWANHYSKYHVDKSWSAFSVIGYSDDPMFIVKPREMSRSWKKKNPELLNEKPRHTRASPHFRCVLEIAKRIPGAKDRVRFMQLRAGGTLQRHSDISDRSAGTEDGMIVRLHIPITTNRAVAFESWSHRGAVRKSGFRSGELFYLDHRKPHRVVNSGENHRVHLVVDTMSNNELRRFLLSGYH